MTSLQKAHAATTFAMIVALSYAQSGAVAQSGSESKAVEITVRVINSNNGEPMGGVRVVAILGRDLDRDLPEVTTRGDGLAVIRLPAGTDWVTVGMSQGFWQCTPWTKTTLAVRDILAHGVVGINTCRMKDKIKGKFVPKPGEVIIFSRPKRFFEA